MNFPRLRDQKDLETLDYLILQTYSSAAGPISSRSSINDRNCPLYTWSPVLLESCPWLSQNLSGSVAFLSPEGSLWKTLRHTFAKGHIMLFLQQPWGGAQWGTISQG